MTWSIASERIVFSRVAAILVVHRGSSIPAPERDERVRLARRRPPDRFHAQPRHARSRPLVGQALDLLGRHFAVLDPKEILDRDLESPTQLRASPGDGGLASGFPIRVRRPRTNRAETRAETSVRPVRGTTLEDPVGGARAGWTRSRGGRGRASGEGGKGEQNQGE